MNMEQAAVFLAGSILTMMGMIVIIAGIVIINNIIVKYWKPITMFRYDYRPVYYKQEEPTGIEPTELEPTEEKNKK